MRDQQLTAPLSLRSRPGRFSAAEQSQFKNLEVAIDIHEPKLPQPAALRLDWGQDVRGLIRAIMVGLGNFVEGRGGLQLLLVSPKRFDEVIVKRALDPRGRRGDVLQIEKQASGD